MMKSGSGATSFFENLSGRFRLEESRCTLQLRRRDP